MSALQQNYPNQFYYVFDMHVPSYDIVYESAKLLERHGRWNKQWNNVECGMGSHNIMQIAVAVFTHAKVTFRIRSRANDWLYEYQVSIVRLVDGRYVGVAFKEVGMESRILVDTTLSKIYWNLC